MEYKVIEESNSYSLEERINTLAKDGWILHSYKQIYHNDEDYRERLAVSWSAVMERKLIG